MDAGLGVGRVVQSATESSAYIGTVCIGKVSGGNGGGGRSGAARRPSRRGGFEPRGHRSDSHASSEVETEEEASEEILPEGEPTYGEACIYGPQGVVHTPIGRDCEAEQAKREGAAKAASAARTQSEPGGSGRCIFGQRGEVVYAPPGVRCDGKVRETQKPKNADKTPRIIRYRPGR